jgi:ATP-dependent DNA helicase RecG
MALLVAEVQELVAELRANRTELQDVEAKTAKSGMPKRLYEPLSALSNRTGGGVILLGLDEDQGFQPTGIDDIAKLQADVTSLATDVMEPSIRLDFTLARIGDMPVLAVEVPECPGLQKPCYYKTAGLYAGAYIRVGASNRRMSDYEVYGYVSAREQPKDDIEPVMDASLDDLDAAAVDSYIRSVDRERPRLKIRDKERVQQLLALKMATERDGVAYPTLAGLLMFGKYPQQFFPSLVITFLRYAGTDEITTGPQGERFLDNREFDGTIPEMLEDAISRVKASMQMRSVITGLLRQDIPEYPLVSLREALVNAVAHRDYGNYTKGSQIQIRMFADRIEIQSPGGLFGVVTEENMDHEQSNRNPVVMRMLQDSGLVENRGTGIATMVQAMRQANLEPPGFIDKRSSFWVIFQNHTMIDSAAVEWLGKLSTVRLSDHQRLALVYLRRHGHMANRDYQRLNNVDGPTATKDLRGLVGAGLVNQHGTRGGAYYSLAEKLCETPAPRELALDVEQVVLCYAEEHGSVSNADVRRLLGVTRRQAVYILKRMVQSGLLRSEGTKKGSKYSRIS